MANNEEVIDSHVGWVNKSIHEYVATKGAQGHDWRAFPPGC